MICPNCGFENENGSRVCEHCGARQTQEPFAPPEPAYAPPVMQAEPKKKSKAGMIIGICAGVLVIAAVIAALFLLFPAGISAQGYWVEEGQGIVLSIDKDDALTMYTLAGSAGADYKYDKSAGEGSFKADNVKYEFTVDEDGLNLTNTDTDDTFKFSLTEEEPNIEEIITAPLLGFWTNEQTGEVLEFMEGGEVYRYSLKGESSGEFDFNINNGEGGMDVGAEDYAFTSDGETLTLKDGPVFLKASDNLDVDEFVIEHGNNILGIWYDTSGMLGTLEFINDGTCIITSYGVPYNGTYTYDNATGTGQLASDNGTGGAITYKDGVLNKGGVYFTQDYVEQASHAWAGVIKVGIVNNPPSDSVYSAASAADFKNVFTEQNGYEISAFYSRNNDEQINAAKQFIAGGVDYLLISAAVTDGWDNVLNDAREAGVKVFLFDRMINCDDSLYEAAVVSDLAEEGKTAVQWLKSLDLPEYNVIHIQGWMGSDAQIGRTAALDAEFAKGTMNMVVQQTASWDESNAKKIVASVIKAGTPFNVIYAENDGMAKGAVAALDAAGITHGVNGDVIVIGFDCNKWALRELLAGNWNYDVQCSPFQASAIDQMIKTLEAGGKLPSKKVIIQELGFDAATITQEDIDKYGLGE